MVNWIVRERLEHDTRRGFKQANITWGNERKPKRGQIFELRGEHRETAPHEMDVEWFFTYVTDDGQVADTAWLDRRFDVWKTSAQLNGMTGLRIKRSPVAKLTREGSKHFASHQRLHQELVMAWGDDVKGWRGRMHQFVGEIEIGRNRAPRSIGTEAQARALIERMVVPMERYEYDGFVAEREARREALAELTERGIKAGETVTKRSRTRASSRAVQPIVVVDKRYVLSRESAGSVENLFQILKWYP